MSARISDRISRRWQQGRIMLRHPVALIVLCCTLFSASVTGIVLSAAWTPVADTVALSAGQVAPQDIRAPRSISYESAALTKLARDAASAAVRPVFDPPNPAALRTQVQQARTLLDSVEAIRASSDTPTAKIATLGTLDGLTVPQDNFSAIIGYSEDDWKRIDAETLSVLERVMRSEIRDSEIETVAANVPNLVSVTLDDRASDLVTELVRGLIRPNAYYNDERTRIARERASELVPAETRSFMQGQIVVRAGSVVSDADIEALAQLQLIDPPDRRWRLVVGALMGTLLVLVIMLHYLRHFDPNLLKDWRRLAALCALFVAFLGGARLFGFRLDSDLRTMLYPAAAFALIAASLLGTRDTIVANAALAALLALMTAFTTPADALRILVFVVLGGTAGVLTLRRTERINTYLTAGIIIGLISATVGTAFALILGIAESEIGTAAANAALGGLLNGGLSAGVGIVGLYILSSTLNLATSIKLLELSAPGQPLLQRLLREAPGTYQHSLMVSNLAELAAEQIDADAALVRIGALYHDIGKLSNPVYFVENQTEGLNPHDILSDPKRSAQIIIGHVTEGAKLGQRYRLPRNLIDFIMQHHGTTSVQYFYNKALEERVGNASQLDKSAFTYPGPRPQTREAGLLMLADASESIVRAKRPRTKAEIATIIRELFEERTNDGQLDDTGLTVNDLRVTRSVFVSTLQGVFHPRIEYPKRTTQETDTTVSTA